LADDPFIRERATASHEFDTAELAYRTPAIDKPPIMMAALPLLVVVLVNLFMSVMVLPRMDASFLAQERWGSTTLAAVGGVWSVAVALAAAILGLIILNFRRLPSLKTSMDSGANAAVLPCRQRREPRRLWCCRRCLAGVRGSTRLGAWNRRRPTRITCSRHENSRGTDRFGLRRPHHCARRAGPRLYEACRRDRPRSCSHAPGSVIGAGTLDSLPHNGAVVTLLAVCGSTHAKSYFDILMVAVVGAILALAAVILIGSIFGSF
jgi:hypothetical protein